MLKNTELSKWDKLLKMILIVYAITQPLLDVLTSVGMKAGFPFSAGMVVRAALMVFLCVYELFLYQGTRRKQVYIGYFIFTLYFAVFLGLSYVRGGLSCAIGNLSGSIKLLFFILIASVCVLLYAEGTLLIGERELAWIAAAYSAIIFIAFLTGTSYVSYNREVFGDYSFGYGYNGWFSAANETSSVISATAPILIAICLYKVFHLTREKSWKKAIPFVGLFLVMFSACMIGTRLVYAIILLCMALCAGWSTIAALLNRNRNYFRVALVTLLCCVSMLAVYRYTPLASYIDEKLMPMADQTSEEFQTSQKLFEEIKIREDAKNDPAFAGKTPWVYESIDENPLLTKLNWIMSRRLSRVAIEIQEYLEGDGAVKLFGIGYRTTQHNYFVIDQPIEIDSLSVLVRHGIVGFALIFLPFFGAFLYAVILYFRNIKQIMNRLMLCLCLYDVGITFAVSNIAGHVITAPATSFCAVGVNILLFYKIKHASDEYTI